MVATPLMSIEVMVLSKRFDFEGIRLMFLFVASLTVPILCPPSSEFVASLLGTWIAGGVAVPLYPRSAITELRYIVDDSEADFCSCIHPFKIRRRQFLTALTTSHHPKNQLRFSPKRGTLRAVLRGMTSDSDLRAMLSRIGANGLMGAPSSSTRVAPPALPRASCTRTALSMPPPLISITTVSYLCQPFAKGF